MLYMGLPERLYVKIVDENDWVIVEREMSNSEVVDLLLNVIDKPLECVQKIKDEEYGIVERRVTENLDDYIF